MPKSDNPYPNWAGFEAPKYTQVPDDLFDLWLPHLSGAEVKVLLYIIRRTFGWKKDNDAISLSQISDGIVKRTGERLDGGAGVTRKTAVTAIQALLDKGLIVAERRSSAERGFESTLYALRMYGLDPWSKNYTREGNNDTSPSEKITPGLVKKLHLQETYVQETDNKSESGADLPANEEVAGDPPSYSPWIADVILDFSRELGDLANSSSNVNRALWLWRQSTLSEPAFVDLLQRAKLAARKQQGRRGVDAHKMRNFFQAVTDLIGSEGS